MVLLDCGLVLEMGPKQHVNLVKVLGAFTKKDGRLAAQLMVDMSAERQQAQPIDVERFVSGVEQLCILDANQVGSGASGELLSTQYAIALMVLCSYTELH
jgi:predicted unusual protein kinase regulating ubiquinone biosynthesis (AarF/ABC1/UbiB family)